MLIPNRSAARWPRRSWVLGLLPLLLPTSSSRAVDALDLDERILQFEDQRVSSPELHSLLRDSRAEVRGRAALALGRIGLASDVPRVAPLLHDPDPEVRRWAAFALGEIDDSTAADPLEQLLLARKESDPEVRALAVEGLGKLRRGEEGCRIALRDEDEAVQVSALLATWKIPVHGAVPELLQMARHKHVELRWAAAYCLMRFLGSPAHGRTPIPGGVDLTPEERIQIEESLQQLIADPSSLVRMQAARGLRNVTAPGATGALLGHLEDEDWRVRVEVLRSLGTQIPDSAGGPRKVPLPPIFARVSDDNPNVGVTAIEAMSHLQGVRPMEGSLVDARLSELLAHPQPRFRETAFLTLATRLRGSEMGEGAHAVLEAQVDTLLADRHWSVRTAVLSALDLLPRDSQHRILDFLRQDDPRVAKLALSPYFRMRAEEGTGALLDRLQPDLDRYLDSPDPILRYSAWDAVRELFVAQEEGSQNTDAGAASSPEAPTAESPSIGIDGHDWVRLEDLLERERPKIAGDPKFSEVRQGMVAIAALRPERPRMEAILHASCQDPSYVVRLEAVRAMRAANLEPSRAAEPVETERTLADYRKILEWSRRDWRAEIETDRGTLAIRLFTMDAPLTCWNFAQLCETSFYDGGNWHRVVPDFVLQDGCPRGDGWGGPPWQIRCEINRRRFERGALGMALSGKDTGGSQFFLTHSDQPHLDGGYTVFGGLLSGHAIADQIVQGAPIHRIRVVEG